MKAIMIFLMFIFTSMIALAQIPETLPGSLDGASVFLQPLLDAVFGGKWLIAGGIVLCIAVVAARQFLMPKWKLTELQIRLVVVGFGSLGAVGLKLATGESVWKVIGASALTVLVSSGLWDYGLEYLTKKLFGLIGVELKAPQQKK